MGRVHSIRAQSASSIESKGSQLKSRQEEAAQGNSSGELERGPKALVQY